MWLILAAVSAASAGFVSITVKAGMKNVDTALGTFLRTLAVLVFAFVITAAAGALGDIGGITHKEWLFIIASGLCAGFSWLCYFKALQIGEVHKVAAVDKLSAVLTMALAIIIFNESWWWLTFAAMAVMLAGSMLMINKKKPVPALQAAYEADFNEQAANIEKKAPKTNLWFLFAVLSLISGSLTSIFAKAGMQDINSNLGTFLRTAVIAAVTFLIALTGKKLPGIKKMTAYNWLFLAVSGILTGVSWLCYYAALQDGVVSVAVPVDKLSIVVTVVFSRIIFKEKLNLKSWSGLVLLTTGTLLLLIPVR